MRPLPYLFCIILFLFQGCHQQNAINDDLYFHPDPSKIYSVTLIKQEASSWKYNNTDHNDTTSKKINFSLKLVCAVDSLYQMKLTFESFIIKKPPVIMIINGVKETFIQDTNVINKGVDLQPNDYWLLLTKGLSLYIWMNKKGEVLQVQGFDKLADSVAVLSGSNKKDVKYALTDNVGDQIICDYLNQLFSIAPNHKENAGDSWVRNIILHNKAPVKLSNMYLINKIDGDSLFVHVTSSISGWAGANATTPFMEGHGEGEIIISRSSGVIYSYQLNSTTKTKTDSYVINKREKFSGSIK